MFINYLKTALAVFRRRKFFTFVNLFGIIFTLTVLLVAIALFDHAFGSAPPEIHLDRTLGVFSVSAMFKTEKGSTGIANSFGNHDFLKKYLADLPGVEAVSINTASNGVVVGYPNGKRIESSLKHVDAPFWSIYEYNFLEGRPFTDDECEQAANVAVINESTRDRFFGSENATGKMLETGGQRYRVVGVVKDVSILRRLSFADIWIPVTLDPYLHEWAAFGDGEMAQVMKYIGSYAATILVKNRSDFPRIKAETQARLAAIKANEPRIGTIEAHAETFIEYASRSAYPPSKTKGGNVLGAALIMTTLALLFMLLPTVNMVNLNISRIMERASEIGVRKAFGASSKTLVGQFIVENILLTLSGGAVAFISTFLVLGVISNMDVLPYTKFSLNYRIFLYGLLTTLIFGVISGVYPAWRMSRMNPVDALRGGVA